MVKGQLFFVVGASGSGKDSVLKAIRTQSQPDDKLLVAHRYITRPHADTSENHIALDKSEFQIRKAHDCFAMNWQAHGLYYGVGREIDLWRAAGLHVLVNGSRGYLPQALADYPEMVTLNIDVPAHLLRERLLSRGREDERDIMQRLQRDAELADRLPENTRRLDNSGSIETAVEQFFSVLRE